MIIGELLLVVIRARSWSLLCTFRHNPFYANKHQIRIWTKALQKQEIEIPTLPGGFRKNIETSEQRNRQKSCKDLIF